MKLLTQELIKKLPALGSQDNVKDPKAIIKFFDPAGSWEWYVVEGSVDEDHGYMFFGLVKGFENELGYFTLNELLTCKQGQRGLKSLPIERDMLFDPTPISQLY